MFVEKNPFKTQWKKMCNLAAAVDVEDVAIFYYKNSYLNAEHLQFMQLSTFQYSLFVLYTYK